MLVGERQSRKKRAGKLKDLEKYVEKMADQLEELNKDLAGIQQGFLAGFAN